jgi:hypothetical protein
MQSCAAEMETQLSLASERPMALPDENLAKPYLYRLQLAPAPERPLDVLSDFLYRQTGGQPLYLLEMLKLLRDLQWLVPRQLPDGTWKLALDRERAAGLYQEESRHELVPTSVRTLILARLAKLSPVTRQLLLASAVLGTGMSAQHLWQVAELGEQDGIEALEEAIGSGLLREEDGWKDTMGTYRCSCDLIREVISTEPGAARRHIVQQRALVLLHRERTATAGLA